MNRPEDLALLRDALLALPDSAAATPDCLGEETIAAFAEARLNDAIRAEVLPHLASCRRCRAAVASVSRALADRAVAREVARSGRTGGRRIYRVVVPLAAAAVLFVFLRPAPLTDGGPAHRAPTIVGAAAPAPAEPIGVVESVRTLSWRPVAAADRYRVTLFAEGGAVIYEAQLADTMLGIPDSIILVPARRYFWKVEGRIGFDRWVASGLAEFTIAPSGPR